MKKVRSFSKLVELVRSNKVYSFGYDIVEYPLESVVRISSSSDVICKALIEDICALSNVYSNISYYCTIERGKLVLRVYLNSI